MLRQLIHIRAGPQGGLGRHQMTVPRGDLVEWYSGGGGYPSCQTVGGQSSLKQDFRQLHRFWKKRLTQEKQKSRVVNSRNFDAALPGLKS